MSLWSLIQVFTELNMFGDSSIFYILPDLLQRGGWGENGNNANMI